MTDNDGLSNGVSDVKCSSLWDMFQIPTLGDIPGAGVYANCTPQIKFSPVCFCMSCKLRIVFTFLNSRKKIR